MAADHLRCPDPAPHHVQHPVDRGRVRWKAIGPPCQPGAQRQSDEVVGQFCQRPDVGRIHIGHQAGEQVGGLGGTHRMARQERDGVASRHVGQERKHLVPDAVADEPRVVIHRIRQGLEAKGLTEGPGLMATQRQQRPPLRRTDAGGSRDACPPQQVQEHGLSLVISGMPREDAGRPRGPAGVTGTRLQVRPVVHRCLHAP